MAQSSKTGAVLEFLKNSFLWCFSGFWICVKIWLAGTVAGLIVAIIFFLPAYFFSQFLDGNQWIGKLVQFIEAVGFAVWFGLFGYFMRDMVDESNLGKVGKRFPWVRWRAKEEITRREFLQAKIPDGKVEPEPETISK